MSLTELRCTRCNAPLPPAQTATLTCRFCGATLVASAPAASTQGKEVFVLVIGRIGPSNRPRLAQALHAIANIELKEAETTIASAPCEIHFGAAEDRAHALKELVLEAGAEARVERRFVAEAVLPGARVSLVDAGHNKISVIKVVREHLDLGLLEAKKLVESAPCVLTDSLEGTLAKKFCDELVAAGARVERR